MLSKHQSRDCTKQGCFARFNCQLGHIGTKTRDT